MRNYIFGFLFASVALSIWACARVPEENDGPKTFKEFSVVTEGTDLSKAVISDLGVVDWSEGDCIGIFSDIQEPVPYYLEADGKFRGEAISGNVFYAYYPYDFVYDKNNPAVLKFFLGDLQSSNPDQMKMPMVAKSNDDKLVFKQTAGLLRFKIKSSKKIAVYIRSYNDETPISGYGTVSFNDEEPILKLSSPVYSTASTVSAPPTDAIWQYYFCLPPVTLPRGFVLEILSQEGEDAGHVITRKAVEKSFTLGRGKMRAFTLFDLDAELIEKEEIYVREKAALTAIYNALDGDSWTQNNMNWCSDLPLDQWSGISTNEMGNVTAIWLAGNGCTGELPNVFDAFPELTSCVFLEDIGRPGKMNISGNIPLSLGSCKKLQNLSLTGSISGSIPDTLRNLENLKSLYVVPYAKSTDRTSSNCLTGSLPSWIGEWKSIQSVVLTNNLLSGELPSGLSELENLERLDLRGNQLSGSIPSSFSLLMSRFPRARYLLLSGNRLSGSIPQEVTTHENFGKFVPSFLAAQQEGYGLTFDHDQIPANGGTFETLEGTSLNLKSVYSAHDYTVLFRWEPDDSWGGDYAKYVRVINKYTKYGLYRIGLYSTAGSYYYYDSLDEAAPHIQTLQMGEWDAQVKDNRFWDDATNYLPFIMVVNRQGNIIFLSNGPDDEPNFSYLSFFHSPDSLDAFLESLLGEGEVEYSSTDYSSDGTVHTLQTASVGNGIDLVLMGDAFVDKQINDGTYHDRMVETAEAFFAVEPYKSFRDCFNVYYVDVVSRNEFYGKTALSTYFGSGSYIGGDETKVIYYTQKAIPEVDRMDDVLTIVAVNVYRYGGTCHMYLKKSGDYGRGYSIAYVPTYSDYTFTVNHEAGGHGFAKLHDEYAYQSYGAIPQSVVESTSARFVYGWGKNVDFTSNRQQVKWSQFITDTRYAEEHIDVYEGACTYWTGAWRPTENSMMGDAGDFNAPSRYAIWYRIGKLAYGDEWAGSYEDFVTWDLAHRTPAAESAQTKSVLLEKRPRLAPPVIMDRSWQEVTGQGL